MKRETFDKMRGPNFPDITYVRTRFGLLHAKREFDNDDFIHLDRVLKFTQVVAQHFPAMAKVIEDLDAYDAGAHVHESFLEIAVEGVKAIRESLK